MNEVELNNKVGKILKYLRNKNKLSQLSVAQEAELSIRHYQKIEYGKIKCQINTLYKILSVYDLNIFSFFSDFILEHFYQDGVEILYNIFGESYFGYRIFDLNGTATYQCKHSETITGMPYEEVVGKIKIWNDIEDENVKKFMEISFKNFIKMLPVNMSWKVNIKNHLKNTHSPYMGYVRFEKDKNNKKCAIEIIIFPI